ncbi:ABC transporter ATP-binding protein [Paenibacillus faecis]|uniref:ABC transporter ATP-binding protein n=1 Tax=Paenibacillus faecis TaxID=862114 RepID=UPI001B09A45C|nr:ABC transporter ATP-binding protein [Paenibacillus faecis]GIO84642.1 ABC transporter ATP-binding protein [Paenibacillus faecis]
MKSTKEKSNVSFKDTGKFLINIYTIIRIIKDSSPLTMYGLLFCNIIVGINVPINLYVWKNFIDASTNGIMNNDYKAPIFWLIILLLVTIINEFMNRVCSYLQNMEIGYLNKYISNIVMNKIMDLDMLHFDNSQIYDTIEKVNRESAPRCASILTMLINLIRNTTSLIGSVIIIITLNPLIALICFCSTLPMFYVSLSISVEQYHIFVSRLQKLRFVNNIKFLSTKYENIKELKIYRAFPFFKKIMLETYNKNLKDDALLGKKFLKKLTCTDILQNLLSYSLKIYILIIVIIKKRSIGELTMYISAVENLETSIRTILDNIVTLYEDNLYIENLFSLMNLKSEMKKDGESKFNADFNIIEFHDVSFRYPNSETYILKNINLKIEKNKTYALVGENGSGKTTLVKLFMRLYDPTEGEILVDGVNIKNIPLEEMYKKISVIFQDFLKYPMSVADNIGIGNVEFINDLASIKDAAKRTGADKFINELPEKYNTLLQKEWDNGVELSIGQWQKLAISRALVNESAILVLDEPSASLDPKSEYEMFRQLREVIPNKTTILITHRFSNVSIADEILVLSGGQLVEKGPHRSLMEKNGVYYDLYNMQVNAYETEWKNNSSAVAQ